MITTHFIMFKFLKGASDAAAPAGPPAGMLLLMGVGK